MKFLQRHHNLLSLKNTAPAPYDSADWLMAQPKDLITGQEEDSLIING